MSALLESNSAADTDSEESQNYENDLQSFAWQNIEIDENKPALSGVIEEIVNSGENQPQIIEAAKAVSEISSGIKWLQNHNEDFERITGRASILVIVLWQSYKKSRHQSLVWPTPKLRIVIDYHIDTVRRILKLMKRKFKNFAKRIFGAYAVRDLGKFKKYEQRLDSVAEDLEKLNNIKINEVLQEVLDGQAQHHDDTELSRKPAGVDSLDKEDTRRSHTQELFVEGSSSRPEGNAAANHTTSNEEEDEEVLDSQTKHHDDDKLPEKPDKNDSLDKGNRQRTADIQDRIPKMKSEEENEVEHLFELLLQVLDAKLSEKPARGDSLDKEILQRRADIRELYNQRKANAAAKPTNQKTKSEEKNLADHLRERLQEELDSQGQHNDDAKLHPVLTSGVSVQNDGSGNVYSRNVGNIEGLTISNTDNDNSENRHFQPMPKPTEKKPPMTPRHITAPAQLQVTTSIHNRGSGKVESIDVGNIKNTNISNVGNNNSKN